MTHRATRRGRPAWVILGSRASFSSETDSIAARAIPR
jgi:hypothetical protein